MDANHFGMFQSWDVWHMLQALDAYDFAKPENVLAMLHKDFWEGVSAAKWTVRRDSLQSLKHLASAPRLASGDYADVVRELRKVRECTLARHVSINSCSRHVIEACCSHKLRCASHPE